MANVGIDDSDDIAGEATTQSSSDPQVIAPVGLRCLLSGWPAWDQYAGGYSDNTGRIPYMVQATTMASGNITVSGIRARLHPSSGRNIGQMWSSQWDYPPNSLFSIDVSASKLTLYLPGEVNISQHLLDAIGRKGGGLSTLLAAVGDVVYVVEASIANNRYGTALATAVIVIGIEGDI